MICVWREDGTEESIHLGGYLYPWHELNSPVVMLQADGHELEEIWEQFVNIPKCQKRVVQFFGETAQFIYNNLEL